jgi:RNA polymerase sigma-54 factor
MQEALELIASLEPKPGRTFSTDEPRYITPDVYILKVDGRFVVVLNEDGLPRLRVSGYYRTILSRRGQNSKETREYVEGKMRSALWLIRSIEQRQRTLYKVTQSIVKFQGNFLEQGISVMRPLTLKEVAEDIQMHESTVSRVTTNKYVHTPQGLFELKYFFHRGVPATDGGATVSSLTVKEIVRKLLTQEDQGKPLSDQKIVEILQQQGVEIARRTVAKYRSQLRIPSSSKRRRY